MYKFLSFLLFWLCFQDPVNHVFLSKLTLIKIDSHISDFLYFSNLFGPIQKDEPVTALDMRDLVYETEVIRLKQMLQILFFFENQARKVPPGFGALLIFSCRLLLVLINLLLIYDDGSSTCLLLFCGDQPMMITCSSYLKPSTQKTFINGESHSSNFQKFVKYFMEDNGVLNKDIFFVECSINYCLRVRIQLKIWIWFQSYFLPTSQILSSWMKMIGSNS